MVLMNLLRIERFKLENVFLVGVIFGLYEFKLNINIYLKFFVVELNVLWENGLSFKVYEFFIV